MWVFNTIMLFLLGLTEKEGGRRRAAHTRADGAAGRRPHRGTGRR